MRLTKRSIIYKMLMAIVLVLLVYGMLSAALFLIASRYQLNNTVGADIILTSNNTEEITRKYIHGEMSEPDFVEAVKYIDQSWGGTITVWDDAGRIIYGDLNVKSIYNLEIGIVDRNSGDFRKGLHYSQTNYLQVSDNDICKAHILVTDHYVEKNSIESAFNSALFFALVLIFSLISIIVFVASYKLERYFDRFREVMGQLAMGEYHVKADESLPAEFGEMAFTLNTLASSVQQNMDKISFERNRLNHILNSLSEGIIALDEMGQTTHVNIAAYYLMGVSKKDSDASKKLRAKLETLIDYDTVREIVVSGNIDSHNVNIQNGKILNITATPLYDNKVICGATILIRDITEMERLEKTRKEYVSNVSHELRSPLTAMRGLIEPLSDGMVKDDETRARYYNILLRETMRLSSLINDLLQLSRLQSGSADAKNTQFNIEELVDYIYDKYQSIAQSKNIVLKKNIYENSDIVSNENRVEQLITILLDNALKYTDKNQSIGIDVQRNANKLTFSVWDTGCGISERDAESIFDRFFMVDRSHNSKGTGLGLAIAKELVEQMGGEIHVNSKLGEGTRFTFTIYDMRD